MSNSSLIYSDSLSSRISRHLLFWVTRFSSIILFGFCVYLTALILNPNTDAKSAWWASYRIGVVRVLIDIAYCYPIAYYLIPKFLLQKKYWQFFLLLFLITIASFAADVAYFINFYHLLGQSREKLYEALWYEAGILINSGPPVVCVFFLAAKMLKDWGLEQRRKLEIVRENANAEFQLLKAQMHPHFIFNTLNNIYSFTLNNHPAAAGMVTKLTGLMDYMNSEGDKDRVPIEREIELIQDYISLERVRYGDRLDIRIEIAGDYKNKMIAPLLLISFVENAFKHGASVNRGNQWLKLDIAIKQNHFCFDLSNSKSAHPVQQNGKKGIGLLNVRKRLQLIYPGKHALQVISSDMAFGVHLEIELGGEPISYIGQEKLVHHQLINYA